MRSSIAAFALLLAAPSVLAQPPQALTPEERAALIVKRQGIEAQLEEIAIIDRKVMVPMRDGKRMAADIYRPKDSSKKYPIIFSRTPYNFNFWDVKMGTYRDMTAELDAVKRGYVLVEMNERGHFFSEDWLCCKKQAWTGASRTLPFLPGVRLVGVQVVH